MQRQNLNRTARLQPRFNLLKVSILAAFVGVFVGVIAKLLHDLIGLVTHVLFYQQLRPEIVSPLDSPLGVLIIFIPALGGLIVGAMAKYGSHLVRGHGIPEAMEAVLQNKSRISPKVAILKPLSAAFSIGSGQPFGAEGPIIQTGGALGSVIGQLFQTTTVERKVLLASGAAGGLAATFGTPIAAVVFAIELLLFEFRTRSFIPIVISSTIATGVYVSIFGAKPIFTVPEASFGSPINLVFFLVLGAICGLAGMLLTHSLYWMEDWFHRLPLSTYLHPALGGLFVGVVGYALPRLTYPGLDVFGPGYYVIENILNFRYPVGFLAVLLLAKSAVWLVSLGSGTSGGTLAPIFMIGASLGGIFGVIVAQIFPGIDAGPLAFAMAGMAAVFGSSTRATFASIIFVFEITQNYHSILPVMLASVVADAMVAHFLPTTILTEQLRRRGILVHHEYEANILNMVAVSAVMDTDPVLVPHTMRVRDLAEGLQRNDPALTRHRGVFVVNAEQQLCGVLTRSDLLKAMPDVNATLLVGDIVTEDLLVAYPDESVSEAMTRMLSADIGRLPVVKRQQQGQVVGYLSRANVINAHMQRLHDETQVDAGWISRRLLRR